MVKRTYNSHWKGQEFEDREDWCPQKTVKERIMRKLTGCLGKTARWVALNRALELTIPSPGSGNRDACILSSESKTR